MKPTLVVRPFGSSREQNMLSRVTYPESYITKYTTYTKIGRTFDESDKRKGTWKVNTRLPAKENSNSHGARPVYFNYFDDQEDLKKKLVDQNKIL